MLPFEKAILLFPKQVDECPNRFAPNLQSSKHRFVLGQNLFREQPCERGALNPVAQELGTGIRG